MPPRYPAFDSAADPALGDGVWRPWIKSEDELKHLSENDREAYLQDTQNKFTAVMDGDGLRAKLTESIIKQRQKKESKTINLFLIIKLTRF